VTGAAGRAGAGAALAALAAAGCVPIETAPGGVSSARLELAPPSIVAGDALRDSTGALTALQVVAFGEDGRPTPTARVRYSYVPAPDTGTTAGRDTALVVDSATGVVRATLPATRPQGRVAAVVGERLQIVQTFEIVPAPDSVVAAPDTINVLRYDCTDPRIDTLFAAPNTGPLAATFGYNAVALPALTVRGADSTGARVGIRSRLVRWAVDESSFPGGRVPRVPSRPGARDSVPVVAVVAADAVRLQSLDTTSTAGASSVRLRVRPSALGRDVVAAREFTVRVRAQAQPGPRPVANNPVEFVVRLARNPNPPGGTAPTCQ
jgi:hypothetical protein